MIVCRQLYIQIIGVPVLEQLVPSSPEHHRVAVLRSPGDPQRDLDPFLHVAPPLALYAGHRVFPLPLAPLAPGINTDSASLLKVQENSL